MVLCDTSTSTHTHTQCELMLSDCTNRFAGQTGKSHQRSIDSAAALFVSQHAGQRLFDSCR